MNNILFAACETELTEHVYYSIEVDNDVAIDGACIISQNEFIEGDRLISITVYKQADGTIITDTLTMGAVARYSTEGSDTVTRSRTISDWGTIC